MKKRILFLIHDLGGGGAEKVLVNLVNHLNKEKFEVHVISIFGGGVNETLLSKEIHYSYVWEKPFPGNSRILKLIPASILHKWCVRKKYDVEIAYLEDICAKIISGGSDNHTKRICWVHTDLHHPRVSARGFKNFEESEMAFESFDRIVCVSDTVRKDFLALYPRVKNAVICYNTLETEKILSLKDEPIEDVDFNSHEIKLIAVGKITKNKGFDRLARIVKRLCEENYTIHFYALGIGPEQKSIETYLANNGIAARYTFLGYQTNPYKYIAASDLFVCASLAEGFSTAATEALIVGTPVCTVEVSGMKEMLGNNEWGVVTDNNDESLYSGIKSLLDEPDKLKLYKEKALERGKMFSTENTVKAVENLLED